MAPSIQTAAQRARLLDHLRRFGSIATSEARERLAVMSPAARIMELRRAGFDIVTLRRRIADGAGVQHSQAVYFLRPGGGAA